MQDTGPTNSSEAIAPFTIEWRGRLGESAADPAQFALFLALHESKTRNRLHFDTPGPDKQDQVEQALVALNHYPPIPTAITTRHIDMVAKQSKLRQQGAFAHALLEECMHPSPIHYQDDASWIDDNVIANCRYATQQAFNHQSDEDTHIEIDATQLVDIVPAAQAML